MRIEFLMLVMSMLFFVCGVYAWYMAEQNYASAKEVLLRMYDCIERAEVKSE